MKTNSFCVYIFVILYLQNMVHILYVQPYECLWFSNAKMLQQHQLCKINRVNKSQIYQQKRPLFIQIFTTTCMYFRKLKPSPTAFSLNLN